MDLGRDREGAPKLFDHFGDGVSTGDGGLHEREAARQIALVPEVQRLVRLACLT